MHSAYSQNHTGLDIVAQTYQYELVISYTPSKEAERYVE